LACYSDGTKQDGGIGAPKKCDTSLFQTKKVPHPEPRPASGWHRVVDSEYLDARADFARPMNGALHHDCPHSASE